MGISDVSIHYLSTIYPMLCHSLNYCLSSSISSVGIENWWILNFRVSFCPRNLQRSWELWEHFKCMDFVCSTQFNACKTFFLLSSIVPFQGHRRSFSLTSVFPDITCFVFLEHTLGASLCDEFKKIVVHIWNLSTYLAFGVSGQP